MRICYVILHYNAIEVTRDCINSIMKIKNNDSCIVVVDNCSPNRSGEELSAIYRENPDVYVIKNKTNDGFARGNNVGYRFAREALKADVIVDMNNDIEIIEENIESIIISTVKKKETVGVISPRIINIKGYDQNPYRLAPMSTSKKIKTVLVYGLYAISLKLPIINKHLVSYYNNRYQREAINDNLANAERENIVPHGSFVIFTPSFVSKFKNAFVEDTFFYGEEDILFDMLTRYGMTTFYMPQIKVLHKEKIATSTLSNDEIRKNYFAAKNKSKSSFVCVKHRIIGYNSNLA